MRTMNAHALLSAQGWRGHGHSLHKADDSIGLAKPLLLNRKDNTRGLGATQHFTSDQWWMNAFDEQLQGLETSKEGHVTQTLTTGKLNAIEKPSLGKYYLYSSFVRGGFLEGTLSALENSTSSSDTDSDDNGEPSQTLASIAKNITENKETKDERRARKEAKRRRRKEKALKKAAKELKKSKSSDDAAKLAKKEKKARRAKKEEKRRQRKEKDEKKKSKK